MTYEQLLTKISKSSPCYRWTLTMLLAFVSMKSGFNIFVLALSTAPVPFHCSEVVVNGNVTQWSQLQHNITSQINITDYTCDRPQFQFTNDGYYVEVQINKNSSSNSKCTSWTFLPDRPDRNTLLMEHNMVCDRSYLANRMQTIMQLGALIGTVTGPIGDIWGRKTLLVMFAYLDLICNFAMIFIDNLEAQMAMLFLMGTIGQGVVASVVLLTELLPESYRGLHGNMIWTLWIAGYSGSAGVSYFIPTWKWQIAFCVALVACGYITYLPFIPESPRWLLLTGRRERAERVVREMCRFAGCKRAADAFDFDNNEITNEQSNNNHSIIPKDNILNCKFLITSSVICLISFSCSLVYFALSFQHGFITDDPYINIVISGLLELPACILAWQLTNRAGRKYSTLITLEICGIGLLLLPIIPDDLSFPLQPIIAFIVKFSITAGFSIFLVYSSELLPTTLRSAALFVSFLVMRGAQFMAPELGGLLAKAYEDLPNLLYGAMSCLFAACLLYLPETKGYDMPNTVDEMPKLGVCRKRERAGSIGIDAEAEVDPETQGLKA